HFGNGTGGVITRDDVEADPTCAERAKKEGDKIYASGRAGASGGAAAAGCVRTGAVTPRSLGPVALGDTEARVRSLLGDPDDVLRGTMRYCAARGGRFVVAERGDRSGDLGRDDGAR